MQQTGKGTTKARRNRYTVLGILIIFTAPVIFAYSAYFGGWLQGSQVNEGELLEVPGSLESLALTRPDGEDLPLADFNSRWLWIYPQTASCDTKCELNLYLLDQSHKAMGKNALRVVQLVVAGEDQSLPELAPGVKGAKAEAERLRDTLTPGYLYLSDPLGNIILRYPQISSQDEAADRSEAMRKDLKRLMKFSRIG